MFSFFVNVRTIQMQIKHIFVYMFNYLFLKRFDACIRFFLYLLFVLYVRMPSDYGGNKISYLLLFCRLFYSHNVPSTCNCCPDNRIYVNPFDESYRVAHPTNGFLSTWPM